MSNYIHIKHQVLKNTIDQCLQAQGLDFQRSAIEAEIMAEADLLSVPSHGVRRLPHLLTALNDGRITLSPKEQTLREIGAISILDCDNGPGRYSALIAMQKAIAHAQAFGIGLCLAKNTTHWGRAHAYASRAALSGCIGICSTNAIPTMAAWGATKKVFGNNPLAIAVPGISKATPVVLDMAMSQASVGKVATMLQEGVRVTETLGFDAEGIASSNPEAILSGAVSAMGAYKGEGLALMMELLTASLSGMVLTHQTPQKNQAGIDPDSSKIFIAINVEAFTPLEEYRDNINKTFTHLKNTTPHFTYPGERGWQAKEQNLVQGIPIHKDIINELSTAGITLL